MRKVAFFLITLIVFSACRKNSIPKKTAGSKILVNNAEKYIGTPYIFGGTTAEGMDCSGLIYKVFEDAGKKIPRISYKQAEYFDEIKLKEVIEGDLVYFKVNSSKINHTGIVSHVKNDQEILFIHASTSKGVREDNLLSKYWQPKFVKVTRPRL